MQPTQPPPQERQNIAPAQRTMVTAGTQHTQAPMKGYDKPPSQVLLPAPQERGDGTTPAITYYGRPMIHKPLWRWYIPLYFFLGGLGGGVAVIASVAHFFGGEKHRSTVRNARYLSLAIALVCPVLLIVDLHRPLRFFNMLRVFKVSSPLSVGTWILTAFGLTSGALAARQAAEDGFIVPRASLPGGLARLLPASLLTTLWGMLGLGLSGYTGTLLAVTAVPVWAAGGVLLGPLFLATGLASGAAALILMALGWGIRGKKKTQAGDGKAATAAREQLEAVETIGAVAQLGLVAAREAIVPPRINKPLHQGVWGRVYQFGAIGGGMMSPLFLRLVIRLSGRRVGGVLSALASTLTLLGALVERFAITEAGKQSADDPLAYQELTRGAPGEARATPDAQAARALRIPAHKSHVAALDSYDS